MRTAIIASLILLLMNSPAESTQQAPLHNVTIFASDYAYRAPTEVTAGLTAIHFVNVGKHPHELQFFRFKPGVSARAARNYLVSGDVPDSAADPSGGVLIAFAGVTSHEQLLVPLARGERYALMCAFRDAPGKPKHNTLGMIALLEVR